MQTIAIILPAYNEEQTIAETVQGFHAALPEAAIFVINNNSVDRTAELAARAFSDLSCRGKVINEPRQGKGNAVRRAFMEVDADVYVMADADLTYPPDQIRALTDPILKADADMVVGNRHASGQYERDNDRRFHVIGNRLVRSLVNTLFGAKLIDITSGYRAFSRLFVKHYPILVEGYQLETDMTLHALHKRFRIIEIPIIYRRRPEGSHSKLRTVSDGMRVVFAIAQIFRYYRPFAFFGAVAALSGVTGLIASIPVISDWVKHHYIFHVPLAILAAALETVAVITIGIGLILNSLTYHQRMDFEQRLLQDSKRGG